MIYHQAISSARAHRGKAASRLYSGGRLCFSSPTRPMIMSTPHHVSSPDDAYFERRPKKQTLIDGGALIFFTGKDALHACRVLDTTNDGAKADAKKISKISSDWRRI
jgi:hypothetical protein